MDRGILEELTNLLEKEPRLLGLLQEVGNAIDCYADDEKNNTLRNSIIYRQFADKLLTDQERASYYQLPKGCRMREGAKIISPENFVCGEYVWFGENSIIDASGGLEVGSHTSIGLSVYLWSHTSAWANIAMANYPGSPFITRKSTKIGSGVFIAGPSVIGPGVVIGDQTIILPLSNVTDSFAEGKCIIGGNPAKIIAPIREDKIEKVMRQAEAQHKLYGRQPILK